MKTLSALFVMVMVMGATQAQAGGKTVAAQKAAPACPGVAPSQVSNSWQAIATLDGLTLLEASYNGEGISTGQGYFMHVLRFQERSDLYTTVVENKVTGKVWLGLLEKASDGVYNWRNIVISPDTKSFEVNFTQAPIFRFAFELDGRGYPSRLVGRSVNAETGAEAIRFTKMREVRLTRQLEQGFWRRGSSDRPSHSLTVISQAAAGGICPGPRSYSATYGTNGGDGKSSATPDELRPSIFPGIYAGHRVLDADYDRRASRFIAYVVVHINGYNDGWRSSKKSKERTLLFEYAAGATGAIPSESPIRMQR